MGRDGSVGHEALTLDPGRLKSLESHLLLFYTGIVRHAHEVLGEQIANTKQGSVIGDLTSLGQLAIDGIDCLRSSRPLTDFGDLLHQAWTAKKRLSSKITSSEIDALYARARGAGAVGGKLLGAGGGGFFLLLAAPESHDALVNALAPLAVVPFAFESGGSVVAFRA
jgi:D-glycero-alpha-D-manno-heptose-7-phosphate kinase